MLNKIDCTEATLAKFLDLSEALVFWDTGVTWAAAGGEWQHVRTRYGEVTVEAEVLREITNRFPHLFPDPADILSFKKDLA